MSLEEKIKEYDEIKKKLSELEDRRVELSAEIMQEMQSKTLHVSHYVVRKYSRLSIKLSLESARALDAIKTQETIDRDKIKVLYENGQKVEGVTENHYIRIFRQKHDIGSLPSEPK